MACTLPTDHDLVWNRPRSRKGVETMAGDKQPIAVIGSGLAGSEAALAIARLGGSVELYEMRPVVTTAAHQTSQAAELVCSNSLRSQQPGTAPWLLKEEMLALGSQLLPIAVRHAIPGGTSLTVDRVAFSQEVTEALAGSPRIELRRQEVRSIPPNRICILATGPLTSDALAADLQRRTGQENLSFHDAINPVIDAETVDRRYAFAASRYGRGGGDFLNCPLSREEYLEFHQALLTAEGVFDKEFDALDFFGCPPIEDLARKGLDTLRFGPLKPVGLIDPRTGTQPYAVLQLRQENLRCDSFNMVGFQNQLKFGEQQRVFRLIPALREAEFIRFGQMHRNTYVRAPQVLEASLQLRGSPRLLLAGQLAGVEGYVEAMATGLLAGINAWRLSEGRPPLPLSPSSGLGALCHYLAEADPNDFVPARLTFDLLPPLPEPLRLKYPQRHARRRQQCELALQRMRESLGAAQPGEAPTAVAASASSSQPHRAAANT
jgi:methylenetetrahydrofolate--tRNA-(uracil-5-)-methyltransferase